MHIIGREAEQKELQRYYDSGRPEFIVVYGRRRVGKTFLIREYFENDFTFYFSAKLGSSNEINLAEFDRTIEEYTETEQRTSCNWFEAFRKLRALINADKSHGRQILFLDEMPWLDTPRSNFLAAFADFWNSYASANPNIMLIVCGSATSWIIKKLFKNKKALHNRLTGRIYIKPFSLHECELLFQDRGIVMTRYQMLESYMVFGGIPYYLDLYKKGLSPSQNIDRLCFMDGAPLEDEYSELYHSLFENADRHLSIVEALTKKKSGMTRDDIAGYSKIPANGHLTEALDELVHCGIIIKFGDFTKPKNGAYYRLVDPFTLFCLEYMRRNTKDEYFWTNYIEDGAKRAWSGYTFELICLLHVREIKQKLGISGVSTNTVAWRSKESTPGTQIDLLIDRRDGVINVCEMKYSKHPYTINKKTAENIERKAAIFAAETGTNKALHITMITTYGISDKGYASIVQSEITMDDLFGNTLLD